MDRRTFLATALGPVAAAGYARAQADGWRTFEVTTRVEIPKVFGLTRVWLPLAHPGTSSYQRVLKQTWRGTATTLRAIRDEKAGVGILFAEWPSGTSNPEVELTLEVSTRDRSVDWLDLTMRGAAAGSLQRYLEPLRAIPRDPKMRDMARKIMAGEADAVAKARAAYEWTVDNAKSPTAAVVFVQLSRAGGVPARIVSGLRLTPGDVTRAQHARAEFHSARHGWVPVDPAAVRDTYTRRRAFGSWDANWLAFNDAHDVRLPGSLGPALPFLMYPQAETGGERLDSLDAASFRYFITARETT